MPKSPPTRCQIRVVGTIATRVNDVFPHLDVTDEGEWTSIEGPVRDQTQLHGILALIRADEARLVSLEVVSCVDRGAA